MFTLRRQRQLDTQNGICNNPPNGGIAVTRSTDHTDQLRRRVGDIEKIVGRVSSAERTAVLQKLQDMLMNEAVEPEAEEPKPARKRRSTAKA